jgi:DNA-binding response OmpR family regulator
VLELKGLLATGRGEIKIPLLAEFARRQEQLWRRPIYYDAPTRRAWVLHRPTEPLALKEHLVFRELHERAGEVVTKDELIQAGWPEARAGEGVADEALVAVVARLRRKVEPTPGKPRFIKTARGHGYRLDTE